MAPAPKLSFTNTYSLPLTSKPANGVGLLLGEQHAAVSGADDPVGGFKIRPNQVPLRIRRDHTGNGGHHRGSLAGQE